MWTIVYSRYTEAFLFCLPLVLSNKFFRLETLTIEKYSILLSNSMMGINSFLFAHKMHCVHWYSHVLLVFFLRGLLEEFTFKTVYYFHQLLGSDKNEPIISCFVVTVQQYINLTIINKTDYWYSERKITLKSQFTSQILIHMNFLPLLMWY